MNLYQLVADHNGMPDDEIHRELTRIADEVSRLTSEFAAKARAAAVAATLGGPIANQVEVARAAAYQEASRALYRLLYPPAPMPVLAPKQLHGLPQDWVIFPEDADEKERLELARAMQPELEAEGA